MKTHITHLTRISTRPRPAFNAIEAAKYLGEILNLATSFLDVIERWQVLRPGKGSTQS